MIQHLPALIVFTPFFAALLCPLLSAKSKTVGRWFVTMCTGVSLVLSILQIAMIVKEGKAAYWFGGWVPPYGIEFAVDSLSAVIMILICVIGFLTMLYGMPFMKDDTKERLSGYYAILSLLVSGLLGMTATGDVFNLYVFLEITSLSGYVLIAMGGDKGIISAFRYLLLGTIGASFYLLGVAFIYGETGTLNMVDMSGLVGPVLSSGTTMIAMIFILLGFGIKMALFPLHGWQPEAHTNAHPGADPIIAGLMVKIPAYVLIRFFFFVFDVHVDHVRYLLVLMGVMASVGIIYGSIRAIAQKDIRKMLAYSSVGQLGYIGLGIAMGNYYGLIGAVLHIINHSFMKSALFFGSGALKYRYGLVELDRLGQIYKKMPKTMAVMIICALSMIGIPPTAGFFSKWYLALGAVEGNNFIFVAVLIASSLLNAVYFFRFFEKIFMGKDVECIEKHPEETRELPWHMMLPLVICGIGILALGFFNTAFVDVLSSVMMGVVE
ncbi:MAG: monovalent cation/H+ antiporter subunit D family protein [Firmicutes bacterium]|nr:monovalent cation/H+ antiporter subunit D family protein [Bacillota bacterium]